MTRKYFEQYQRMVRCFVHLSPILTEYFLGDYPDDGRDDQMDLMYSFFMQAYHLKDWIKHDVNVPASVRDAVEGYINATRALRLCADICNGFKHLTLTKPRSGENPSLSSSVRGTTLKYIQYSVNTDSGGVDVGTLSADCIAARQSFMVSHGLLSQSECKIHHPPVIRLPRYT